MEKFGREWMGDDRVQELPQIGASIYLIVCTYVE